MELLHLSLMKTVLFESQYIYVKFKCFFAMKISPPLEKNNILITKKSHCNVYFAVSI